MLLLLLLGMRPQPGEEGEKGFRLDKQGHLSEQNLLFQVLQDMVPPKKHLLRHQPANAQIGLMEGNTFCTTLQPRLFTMDLNVVEHKVFYTEVQLFLCLVNRFRLKMRLVWLIYPTGVGSVQYYHNGNCVVLILLLLLLLLGPLSAVPILPSLTWVFKNSALFQLMHSQAQLGRSSFITFPQPSLHLKAALAVAAELFGKPCRGGWIDFNLSPLRCFPNSNSTQCHPCP